MLQAVSSLSWGAVTVRLAHDNPRGAPQSPRTHVDMIRALSAA